MGTDIILNKKMMSSIEIAELTGRNHKDVMRSIRNMEAAWVKVNGRNFELVEYKDAKGEMRPCYELTKTECLYIATKFNDEARAKLVLRWEKLETEKKEFSFKELALMLLQKAQEEREQLLLENDTLKCEKQELLERNEKLVPKATFADCIMKSDDDITLGEMAQILNQNGAFQGGRTNLFNWMRHGGWLLSRGPRRNLPSQKAIKMGLMRVAEQPCETKRGITVINRSPVITPKGQQYFLKLFGDDAMIDQRRLNFSE